MIYQAGKTVWTGLEILVGPNVILQYTPLDIKTYSKLRQQDKNGSMGSLDDFPQFQGQRCVIFRDNRDPQLSIPMGEGLPGISQLLSYAAVCNSMGKTNGHEWKNICIGMGESEEDNSCLPVASLHLPCNQS